MNARHPPCLICRSVHSCALSLCICFVCAAADGTICFWDEWWESLNFSLTAVAHCGSCSIAQMFALALAVCVGVAAATAGVLPGSERSHHLPVESHHSLSQPYESQAVYWRFGGHTVQTAKSVRLTPSSQDSRGTGCFWNVNACARFVTSLCTAFILLLSRRSMHPLMCTPYPPCFVRFR